MISGWACNAQEIEISFNGGPRLKAAVGTIREDTQGVCGDTDNGFGLLYNWNRLGDGAHTVAAYADGVEFASVQVIVTTLGEEFLQGASGTFPLSDFPTPGETRTLRWQQAQQNFVITAGNPQGGGTSGAAPHVLENPQPGSFQSGVGVISGWACEAQTVEVSFDGGPRIQAGTGTIREDTQSVCGDTNNGFGFLYNWNRLGDGPHTVTAYADGVEFAEVTATVTTLGAEFQQGLSREVTLPDFPDIGNAVVLKWQGAQQNFVTASAIIAGEFVVSCEDPNGILRDSCPKQPIIPVGASTLFSQYPEPGRVALIPQTLRPNEWVRSTIDWWVNGVYEGRIIDRPGQFEDIYLEVDLYPDPVCTQANRCEVVRSYDPIISIGYIEVLELTDGSTCTYRTCQEPVEVHIQAVPITTPSWINHEGEQCYQVQGYQVHEAYCAVGRIETEVINPDETTTPFEVNYISAHCETCRPYAYDVFGNFEGCEDGYPYDGADQFRGLLATCPEGLPIRE